MDRDGHDAVAATPNGQNDRHKKKGIPSPSERRSLIDRVKLAFSHGLTSHGALTEKVVLYGTSGQGKRHVAAQIAKEITQADGRRVLRINGLNFETFIRDYCLLYHDLTGQYLPRGLGLAVTLAKIKHMLEERRQEWLMVITDLGLFSDDYPELVSSLPDRGHIIVTSDEIAFPPTGKKSCVITLGRPFSPLTFANKADEVHVKGLIDAERRQFARNMCPDLLNITWSEFGIVQRSGHNVPLYLVITGINLQLLRMDFATYCRFFERQFGGSHMDKSRKVGGYTQALHVATKVMWDALGDYDVWVQRLLIALTVVRSHPVPLGLLQRLSTFSKPITDHLSPALEFLISLGVITKSNESEDSSVSIMHHKVSSWLWKHLSKRSRDDLHQAIRTWVSLLSTDFVSAALATHSPSGLIVNSTPYDLDSLWQCLPLILDLVKSAALIDIADTYRLTFFSGRHQRIMVLDFFLNVAETLVSDRRIPAHARIFVTEAYRILLEMRYLPGFTNYQSYLLRVKLVQIKVLMAGHDGTRAAQELQTAKRVLRMLTYSVQDPYTFNSTSGSDQQVHQPTSTPVTDIAASTAPSVPSATAFQAAGGPSTPAVVAVSVPFKPSLLALTQQTFDLEAQLLFSHQRYSQAFNHLTDVLRPTPDETSPADPYVLARRYYWVTCALIGEKAQQAFEGEALIWSHAAMCAWTTWEEDERWGQGARAGVEVLAWVEQHALLLIDMRKFRGALLFLPRLLDVWQELIPMGGGKLWTLARMLVECYVKLDMIKKAEEVAVRMLEIVNDSSKGVNNLLGLGGAREGGGYENETIGSGEGRETFWWMLIELARGYMRVGSFTVAEGIVRFCLGSWRRRHVGECEETEFVDVLGESAAGLTTFEAKQVEHKPRTEQDVESDNQESRQRRKERERTWKENAPTDWWALLMEVMIHQGKVKEPKQLMEELTREDPEARHELQQFFKRVEAYRLMTTTYQRAIWAEEDGCLREWKMLLGESRDRFLLRRAVKIFGSVSRRVREKRDFVSDIDLNLESHAEHSNVLNLLDRNWGHKYGFSPRSRWETEDYEDDVVTHPTRDQSYLCELWLWCQCKKRRSRAWSIGNSELVRKRLILEGDKRERQPKPLRQTSLDDWLYLIVQPVYRPEGCRDDCRCIDANIAGLAQEAALGAALWTYTEPTHPHRIPMATEARYKKPHNRANTSQLPGFDFDVDRLTRKSNDEAGCVSWLWYAPHYSPGDYDDENYIRPHALDLPNITITFVDDDDDDDDNEEPHEKVEDVRKHLKVPIDKPLLREPFVKLSAGNRLTMEKPGREKQKKKLERLARAYSDTPSIVQSEHIKPYLVMDEKTRAKYAEKARHAHDIVMLDEYYMPVETILEDTAEVEAAGGTVNSTADGAEESPQVGDPTEAGHNDHAYELGVDIHVDDDQTESQATIDGATEVEAADEVRDNGCKDS